MTRQWIYLDGWEWMILVYYNAARADAPEILKALERIGCSGDSLRRAKRNLRGRMIDTGLTYTNESLRATVMVISESSSIYEFWSTLDYEKGHASKHIAQALGLDCNGEAVQYLSGDLTREMYPVAKRFI